MKFKLLLESKGLSGYRFSQLTGIHQPAVSKMVTGKRSPIKMSLYSAKKAADVLGLSLEQFYTTLSDDNSN